MTRQVIVELLKYPGRPSRIATTEFLGEDEYGTWLGADRLVYLIPYEGWWKARHFPDGGWKIDITTPATWQEGRVVLEDLALDVRRHHWQTWVEDEDEFARAVDSGLYPREVAREARAACDDLLTRLHREPFRSVGDVWLGRVPSRFDDAILLDMGGVLGRGGTGSAAREWEHRLGLEPGGMHRAFSKAIGPGWEGGRSVEEISWILRAELGLDHAGLWKLRVDLMSDSRLDDVLVELLASRRPTTAAAVVSNNGANVRPVWEAAFNINAVVDLIVISGEERVAKPSRQIFEIICGRLGVPPQRCVFVDDSPEHVVAAHALGMRAIQHSSERPAYSAIAHAVAALHGE